MSLFLSLSPSLSHSLSLSSSLIRYTDSSFNGRHLVQSALSCFLASRSISDHSSLIRYSCNINSHEYLLLGVHGRGRSVLTWAQAREQLTDRAGRSQGDLRNFREKALHLKSRWRTLGIYPDCDGLLLYLNAGHRHLALQLLLAWFNLHVHFRFVLLKFLPFEVLENLRRC